MQQFIISVCVGLSMITGVCHADWVERFTLKEPPVSREGVAVESDAGLPLFHACTQPAQFPGLS